MRNFMFECEVFLRTVLLPLTSIVVADHLLIQSSYSDPFMHYFIVWETREVVSSGVSSDRARALPLTFVPLAKRRLETNANLCQTVFYDYLLIQIYMHYFVLPFRVSIKSMDSFHFLHRRERNKVGQSGKCTLYILFQRLPPINANNKNESEKMIKKNDRGKVVRKFVHHYFLSSYAT